MYFVCTQCPEVTTNLRIVLCGYVQHAHAVRCAQTDADSFATHSILQHEACTQIHMASKRYMDFWHTPYLAFFFGNKY